MTKPQHNVVTRAYNGEATRFDILLLREWLAEHARLATLQTKWAIDQAHLGKDGKVMIEDLKAWMRDELNHDASRKHWALERARLMAVGEKYAKESAK